MSWKGRTVGKELLDTFKVLRERKKNEIITSRETKPRPS